ncbi:MAG TPA: hypothetical protein ENF57_01720 [Candidatus Korarchaeota archaeon]|nr:hypothetical protein [Candidatus Korarchaeota archaeon]
MDVRKLVVGVSPTKKLYLEDPYLREAKAEVLVARKERRNVYIVLNRSIYHPKGGGQPTDLGFMRGEGFTVSLKKVMEVRGVLVHFGKLSGRLPGQGEEVNCSLDWERRYLIMRLHTAGHILDHAIRESYGRVVDTLGANHGPPEAFTEYKAGPPDLEQIKFIAERANEVVRNGREVRFVYVTPEELPAKARGAPNLDRLPPAERYRLVVIEGINAIPCTGTHVMNTREVGFIELKGVEETERGFKLYYDVR